MNLDGTDWLSSVRRVLSWISRSTNSLSVVPRPRNTITTLKVAAWIETMPLVLLSRLAKGLNILLNSINSAPGGADADFVHSLRTQLKDIVIKIPQATPSASSPGKLMVAARPCRAAPPTERGRRGESIRRGDLGCLGSIKNRKDKFISFL